MKKVYMLIATIIALFAVVGASAPSLIALQPRNASVPINRDDSNALLSIRNSPHSPYQFISYDSATGKFVITVRVNPSVSINPDSENWFDQCINIFNQGLEAYTITITSDNSVIQFYPAKPWQADKGRGETATTLVSGPIGAGITWEIGLYVDARGHYTGETLTAQITITAVNP